MSRTNLFACLSLSCGMIAAATIFSHAGPLDPPSGAIAPTYKTLSEVEPRIAISLTNTPGDSTSLYRISQPGSYYLTGNVQGVVGKHGIRIAAVGVTLDLNGFEVLGAVGVGDFDGIVYIGSDVSNLTIRNGSVRRWGDRGVEVNATGASVLIEKITATNNVDTGISSGGGATISHCVSNNNGGSGISTGASLITACSAMDNAGNGISVGQGGMITNCNSFSNDGYGIFTGFGALVEQCAIDNNGLSGINSSNGSRISNCSLIANGEHGIFAYNSIAIENCTSVSNTLDGIRVGGGCVVRNNTTRGNGTGTTLSSGIRATGSVNRIEGNHSGANDYGIYVESTGNIIVRNTCANNTTSWIISSDNFYGTIVDRSGSSTSPVAGSSAPDALGSTNATANFTH
jgi:hypothetical protein